MTLKTEPYLQQAARWPDVGSHLMAHFDTETIVVYQAYRAEIGHFAIANQSFGGAFSFSRMSWIKPNFLWMMYRSGWGTKTDQELTLGVRLRRTFFDDVVAAAVASTFDVAQHPSREAWQAAVAGSDVRLQWDPDHDPYGAPLARRAIQLGLRGATLARYGREAIVEIIDMSAFVAAQRVHVDLRRLDLLEMPREDTYPEYHVANQGPLTRLPTA